MIPGKWFYITSPSRHNHVLTVVNVSFEPQTRVELRPNINGPHQLWIMDPQGYLINKHSGCVLAVKAIPKKRSVQDQTIMQARRQAVSDAKAQLWEWVKVNDLDGGSGGSDTNCHSYYLRLRAFSGLYLTDKDVPAFGEHKATNQTYVDRSAAFGPRISDTEDSLTGYLVAPPSLDLRHGCEVMEPPSDKWIALIERGNCSFIDKVRSMQQSGAIAVVVGDKYYNGWVTMYAPGDTSDVQIPSVFVAQRQYQSLLQQSELFKHPMEVRMEKDDMLTWPLLDMLLVVVLSPAVMMLFIYTTWRMRQRQQRKEELAPTDFVTKLPLRTFKKDKLKEENGDESMYRHVECAICLEDYMDGDVLRVLPCKHDFHSVCIDAWLTGHKKFCPVCKFDVCRKEANENTPLLPV